MEEDEEDWSGVSFQKLASFAWDQSDKFVSVYVSWPGAGQLFAERGSGFARVEFGPKLLRLRLKGGGKENRELLVRNLCHPIDVAKSKLVPKEDRLVVKLKKAAAGTTWSDLDDAKDLKESKRKQRVENGGQSVSQSVSRTVSQTVRWSVRRSGVRL